jgi:hypothetical protein
MAKPRQSGQLHPEKARKTRQAWAAVRGTIRVDMLVGLCHGVALGELEISPTRARIIECLLRKVLPDLQTVEYTGVDVPVVQKIERVIVQPRGMVALTDAINNGVIDQEKLH